MNKPLIHEYLDRIECEHRTAQAEYANEFLKDLTYDRLRERGCEHRVIINGKCKFCGKNVPMLQKL